MPVSHLDPLTQLFIFEGGHRTRAACKSETASTALDFFGPFAAVWYEEVMLISFASSFPAKLASAPGA
jgi:hypothetical protein